LGAITFIQRFGSSLNLHVHYHTIIIEGLFYPDGDQLVFNQVKHFGPEDAEAIQLNVRKRVVRLFMRHNLLTEDQASNLLSWRHE